MSPLRLLAFAVLAVVIRAWFPDLVMALVRAGARPSDPDDLDLLIRLAALGQGLLIAWTFYLVVWRHRTKRWGAELLRRDTQEPSSGSPPSNLPPPP